MAIYAYLGQVPAQWFSEAGDAALAGGVIRFYDVGTTTPKEVFLDYQGLASAGSSVTLDASGRANIFWSGLFKVTLEDADGNLIGNAIDGVGPGALGAGGSVVYVGNYDAVRALGGGGETIVVYVEGREANGDGGAGAFVWDSLSTDPDDDGTILAPSSNPVSGRYIRVGFEELDPRWFGVVYGSADDQTTAHGRCLPASERWNAPVAVRGRIRLAQNVTIESGQQVALYSGGEYHASESVAAVMTFASGSRFYGYGGTFGVGLQPVFASGVAPEIRLSWMGGVTGDEKLAKLHGCQPASPESLVAVIDANISVSSSVTLPAPWLVRPDGGLITATSQIGVSACVEYSGRSQWVEFGGIANVGTIAITGDRAIPEWFGGVGDGVTDCSDAILAVLKSRHGHIPGKNDFEGHYYCASDLATGVYVIDVTGECDAMSAATISNVSASMPKSSIILASGKKITGASDCSMSFDRVGIFATGSGGGIDCNTGRFSATGCVLAFYSLALVGAAYASSADCYANSALVLAGASTYSHSNLRSNVATDRRYYTASSHKDVWLENEAGEASTYTNLLHTLNADGKVDGTHSPVLDVVTANSLLSVGTLEYTNIVWDNAGLGFVYRDGVSTGISGQYTIQSGDKPNIKFSRTANAGGDFVVIMGTSKPSNSTDVYLWNATQTWGRCAITADSTTWGGFTEYFPDAINVGQDVMRHGRYLNGKWAFGG